MRSLLEDEGGQTVVEYVLSVAIAVTVVSTISIVMRRSLFRVWEFMTKMISAACPGCPADPRVRFR